MCIYICEYICIHIQMIFTHVCYSYAFRMCNHVWLLICSHWWSFGPWLVVLSVRSSVYIKLYKFHGNPAGSFVVAIFCCWCWLVAVAVVVEITSVHLNLNSDIISGLLNIECWAMNTEYESYQNGCYDFPISIELSVKAQESQQHRQELSNQPTSLPSNHWTVLKATGNTRFHLIISTILTCAVVNTLAEKNLNEANWQTASEWKYFFVWKEHIKFRLDDFNKI